MFLGRNFGAIGSSAASMTIRHSNLSLNASKDATTPGEFQVLVVNTNVEVHTDDGVTIAGSKLLKGSVLSPTGLFTPYVLGLVAATGPVRSGAGLKLTLGNRGRDPPTAAFALEEAGAGGLEAGSAAVSSPQSRPCEGDKMDLDNVMATDAGAKMITDVTAKKIVRCSVWGFTGIPPVEQITDVLTCRQPICSEQIHESR